MINTFHVSLATRARYNDANKRFERMPLRSEPYPGQGKGKPHTNGILFMNDTQGPAYIFKATIVSEYDKFNNPLTPTIRDMFAICDFCRESVPKREIASHKCEVLRIIKDPEMLDSFLKSYMMAES